MFEALRWRLTAWYVLAFALAFVVVGVIVFVWVDHRLSNEVDAAMREVSDAALVAVQQREQQSLPSQNPIGLGLDDVKPVLASESLGRWADVTLLIANPDRSSAANPGEVPQEGLPGRGALEAPRARGREDWRSPHVEGHHLRLRTQPV